jgi:hypothetical protein
MSYKNIGVKMKFFKLILLGLILCSIQPTKAELGIGGYTFTDEGFIFTRASYPVSVANSLDGNNDIDLNELKNLKKGETSSRNFFHLVEVGNAGINRAAKKGGITNIKYVDTRTSKIYIPFFFIPIAARETRTIVYGE